ncbi:MAG: polysaccharide biosynthesis protein [Lacibacter sp.]
MDFRLLGVTTIIQLLIQLLGLISGIIIIRLLPTKEYAWYTIANTMLGTMSVLSDAGISTAMMAHGGKVWMDRNALGVIFATAYDLRKKFALGSVVISLPFLYYLLHAQGASIGIALLISVALLPSVFASLSDNLLQIGPKLQKDILPLQRNALFVSVYRTLIFLPVLFLLPFTWVAIFNAGVIRILGNYKLKKINSKWVDMRQQSDPQIAKSIMVQVRRLMPGVLYYCFSGQIAVWLISIFGQHDSVASLGALARFSVLFAIVPVLFGTMITPYFSKLTEQRHIMLNSFFRIQSLIVLGALIVVFIFYVFSDIFLWVLGPSYSNLKFELVVNIISSLLGVAAGLSFSLFTSRGWSMHPAFSITVNLLSLIAGIFIFDIKTLCGVLMMNVFVNTVQYFVNGFFCWYKINSLK